MFNLLLVDDERPILDGLYAHVDWKEAGFSQAFCASNGLEAVRILEKEHIDLVISDIRMEGMDGLTLGAMVRQRWPLAKVIFLTGFSDFDYARKAVELGAFKYLVKPVGYPQLGQAAAEALKAIRAEMDQRDDLKRARQVMLDAKELMQERFLRNWIVNGRADLSSPEARLLPLEDCESSLGQLMLTRLDETLSRDACLLTHQITIESLAEHLLPKPEGMFKLSLDSERLLLLFVNPPDKAEAFWRQLRPQLDAFQETIQETLHVDASIFLCPPVPLPDLNEAYQRISRRSLRPDARSALTILELDEGASAYEPHIRQGFLAGDMSFACRCVDETVSHAPESALTVTFGAVLENVIREGLRHSLRMDAVFGMYTEYLQKDCAFDSRTALADACRRVVGAYFEAMERESQKKRRSLMNRIDELVKQSLEEVTVSSIASDLHYNACYLSRIVKGETGETLGDYITSQRLEIAKAALNSGRSVNEAANQAGYANMAYFTRLFTKRMGVNPSKYGKR